MNYDDAVKLLREWMEHCEGKGQSEELRQRTEDFLVREGQRFKPTPEEEERMTQ